MGMLSDIQVPLPAESETARQDHLAEVSDRLTTNLRIWLGDDFEIVRGARPVAFSGQWTRRTEVYRDGMLRATFSVHYDCVTEPDCYEVHCLLPNPAVSWPSIHTMAASIALAAAGTALAGPLAGVLAGGTTLLTGIQTERWRVSTDSPADAARGDSRLLDFDLRNVVFSRNPLPH